MLVESTAADRNLVFLYKDDKLDFDDDACVWLATLLRLEGFKPMAAFASGAWDYIDREFGEAFPSEALTDEEKFLAIARRSDHEVFRIHGEYHGQKVIVGIDLESYVAFIVRGLDTTGIQEDLAEALQIA
ncbi:MAG: hypothetical protein IJ849_04445 [Selenomonadaceae bacterium]|nr:hypothetical protein [Selenomonadaceae bacterium]